jgi:protein-S-isoprenylcysteine O-methyltransferase Ste14
MKPSATIVTVVPIVGLLLLLVKFAEGPWPPLKILGFCLTLCAAVLITIARFQLGNSFSVSPQATALVTHGLYARIRNPVYVFGAVLIAGVLLYVGQPRLLWILAVLIPMQVLRARAESKVLEEKFGDAYRDYKSQTWF